MTETQHRARIRRPGNLPLTAKAINEVLAIGHRVTADVMGVMDEYPELAAELLEQKGMLAHLTEHQEKIAEAISAGVEHALFGQTSLGIKKPRGDMWLLDASLPETAEGLQSRFLESCEYERAVLGEIKGLNPPAQDFCMKLYVGIIDQMMQRVEAIQRQAGVQQR